MYNFGRLYFIPRFFYKYQHKWNTYQEHNADPKKYIHIREYGSLYIYYIIL